MKKIKLTKGKVAIVDDEDYNFLIQRKWYYSTGYAMHREYPSRKILLMHRVIAKTEAGKDTDHRDGDTLNNRRSNLRSCSRSENNMNKGLMPTNTSGYKGVFWRRDRSKWRAKIGKKTIGLFDSKIEAAKAYDREAKRIFGEFAKPNFSA